MKRPSRDIRHEPSLGYEVWRAVLAQLGDTTPRPAWEDLKREEQVTWACLGGLFGAPVSFQCTPEEDAAANQGIAEALARWGVTVR
jgi:hypothetical protein